VCCVYTDPGRGCCPVISQKESVITGHSGYRGAALLIIDWGTCSISDVGFK